MAITHGRNAVVLLNGINISGDLNMVNPKSINELIPYATFGVTGYKQAPGLAKDEVSFDALFNSTSVDIVNSLTQLASTGYQMMVLQGNAVGGMAYAANQVKLKKHEVKSVVRDINRYSASFETEDIPFAPSNLLTTGIETLTGSGQETSIDGGAASADGAEAYLQAISVTGGTLTIVVQTSSTGAAWTAWAGFTVTASSGAERLSATGRQRGYHWYQDRRRPMIVKQG